MLAILDRSLTALIALLSALAGAGVNHLLGERRERRRREHEKALHVLDQKRAIYSEYLTLLRNIPEQLRAYATARQEYIEFRQMKPPGEESRREQLQGTLAEERGRLDDLVRSQDRLFAEIQLIGNESVLKSGRYVRRVLDAARAALSKRGDHEHLYSKPLADNLQRCRASFARAARADILAEEIRESVLVMADDR